MKTRLLLLLLLVFSIGNAQINVSEGFESGVIPTGWGNNNFSITGATSCTGSYSCSFNSTGLGAGAELATPTYISSGGSITVSCDYKRNSSGGTAIFYLQYYNFNTSSWVTITTTNPGSTTCGTLTGTILAGTISSGANVVFKMYLYGTNGSLTFYLDNFSAIENIPQTIAEYSFDNTYNNVLGSAPFASNANTSFTTDRNSSPTGAINIGYIGSTATISNLPYGNTQRSISVWVKLYNYDTGSFINPVFYYGTLSNDNMFGGTVDYGETSVFGYNNNYTVTTTNNLLTWYHYVYVYDGTTAKIYKDGVLLGSQAKSWNTINDNNLFRIGTSFAGAGSFSGAIDDLKIYNYVLSEADITSLYNNNTLSSQDFSQNNLEVKLYPNPVNDVLNIETVLEIKSIEICNIQGQKVLESNQKQINVSNLASGMYMVKIQDVENNSVTKKVIIK